MFSHLNSGVAKGEGDK